MIVREHLSSQIPTAPSKCYSCHTARCKSIPGCSKQQNKLLMLSVMRVTQQDDASEAIMCCKHTEGQLRGMSYHADRALSDNRNDYTPVARGICILQRLCTAQRPSLCHTRHMHYNSNTLSSSPSSFCRIRLDMQLAAVYSPPMIANVCEYMHR